MYAATGYSPALGALLEKTTPAAVAAAQRDPNASDLLRKAPLSDAPLVFAGLSRFRAGDSAAADRAFAVAFARGPRNAPARIWLAQKAIDAKNFGRAIDLLEGLIRISPDQAGAYVEALAQIAVLPGGAAALETRLGSTTSAHGWGDAVVSRLNKSLPDFAILLQLNLRTPATQREFLTRLLKERGVQEAFLAWLSLVSADDIQTFRWPYDATFEKKDAPPPFNWTTYGDQVEFSTGGGLSLTYLGRGRVILADQTMLLGPGSYRFKSSLTGDAQENGGGLGWAVECDSDGQVLGQAITRKLSTKSSDLSFDFAVPPLGCPAQKLVLRGEPGEFPIRLRGDIRSVSIDRQTIGAAK